MRNGVTPNHHRNNKTLYTIYMHKNNYKIENNSNNTGIPVFYSFMTKADLYDMLATVIKEVIEANEANRSFPMLNPDELLTREEAAKEFKVSVATIDNYRREGRLVPCRLKGTVRYKRSDLQAAFSGNILNPYKATRKGKKA